MPTRRFELAMGGKEAAVAETTPAGFGSNLVRLDIDYTATMTRQLALEAIDEIKQRIIEGSWPPA